MFRRQSTSPFFIPTLPETPAETSDVGLGGVFSFEGDKLFDKIFNNAIIAPDLRKGYVRTSLDLSSARNNARRIRVMTHDPTTTATARRCEYCRRPGELGGHNEGCPVEIGTSEAMAEWNRGWRQGFHGDHHIKWWEREYYPLTWLLGQDVGYREICVAIEYAYEQG